MEERNQFTFYKSFYEALRYIRKATDRAKAYDAICNYAIYGIEPDMDALPDTVALALSVIKPVIESSNRKANAGKAGGSKPKATGKQTESKTEANASSEKANGKQEKEQDKEQDKEQMLKGTGDRKQAEFEKFWAVYPKKVGKGDARKSFAKVKVSVDTLIAAVEAQKRSNQWTQENGRYIPNPSTWLNQERWEDEVTVSEPQKTDFSLSESEMAAIRDMQAAHERRMRGAM
jgi:hypothetical protein